MKRRIMLVIAILLAAGAVVQAQGNSDSRGQASAGIAEDLEVYREPEALRKLMEDPPENLFLVDVRTPEEYAAGHIAGAISIDYRTIGNAPPTDDRDAVIIVYCRSGSRSNAAFETLKAMGYSRLLDWGGIMRWPFDVVTGSEAR